MKLFQKLVCMALTATATASLSICAFAADYTFDTAADTDYYGRVQKLHPPILFAETLISCHRHRDLYL